MPINEYIDHSGFHFQVILNQKFIIQEYSKNFFRVLKFENIEIQSLIEKFRLNFKNKIFEIEDYLNKNFNRNGIIEIHDKNEHLHKFYYELYAHNSEYLIINLYRYDLIEPHIQNTNDFEKIETIKTDEFTKLNTRILQSEYLYSNLLNTIHDGLCIWNINSNTFSANYQFYCLFGYDPYEIAIDINTITQLFCPTEKKLIIEKIDELKSGKIESYSNEYRLMKKNKEYSWILLRIYRIQQFEENVPLQIVFTFTDINETKKLELLLLEKHNELERVNKELNEINKKLEKSVKKIQLLHTQLTDKQSYINSVLKAVPALIALVSDRIILYVNEYASILSGYTIDEILGREVSYFYPSEEEYERVKRILYESESEYTVKNFTTVWKLKNGTLIDVWLHAAPLRSKLLPSNTYIIVGIDISERKIYEEELIQAKEKAERAEMLKTKFLCNISHELRTPANGIIGFAEMLLTQTNLVKRDQYLKIIINSSKQLLKIVTDIIEISKIETNDIEIFESEVDLTKLIKELFQYYSEILTTRKKIEIDFTYQLDIVDSPLTILSDEKKLYQILSNVLHNAVKFTDKGSIRLIVKIENTHILFQLKDTGIGISPEEQEYVFERFRQSEKPSRKIYGGNGLGLAIAKGYTEALGGKIWLESEKDKGTTIFISIPYKPIKKQNMTKTQKWSKFKLLIVDDDVVSASLIKAIVETTGIEIQHTLTGLEAIKLIKHGYKPDLILMDMRLPEIDGYETTRRIKEMNPNIPIIAQTAFALTEDRNKCLSAGCNEYLTKPIKEDDLFSIMEIFLPKI